MALIDGKRFADERLLDAAGHILHAYYKAPLVTGRLNQQAVIICGEELAPMLELIEKMDEKLKGAAKELFFPLYVDYMCLKVAIDQGYSPVLISLGADCMKADLGWDCGACGFPTCAEYIKHCKVCGGLGTMVAGPSCAWKSFDYGIASDYACAAAGDLNVENRILGTFGLISTVLGYLEGASVNLALALGPQTEMWWYSRPSMAKWLDSETLNGMLRRNYTFHFQMFSTKIRPQVKKDGAWWSDDPEFSLGVAPDENYSEGQAKIQAAMMESILEVQPKVEKFKEKMAERTNQLTGKS